MGDGDFISDFKSCVNYGRFSLRFSNVKERGSSVRIEASLMSLHPFPTLAAPCCTQCDPSMMVGRVRCTNREMALSVRSEAVSKEGASRL